MPQYQRVQCVVRKCGGDVSNLGLADHPPIPTPLPTSHNIRRKSSVSAVLPSSRDLTPIFRVVGKFLLTGKHRPTYSPRGTSSAYTFLTS